MDPVTTAGLVGGLFSGLGSIFGASSANDTNQLIARENRAWQSGENQLNRDWQTGENDKSRQWQERMWNLQNQYNTPSAMMQRYKDAGLNPFLVNGSPTVGSAGSAGSPSTGSPSMVGAPNMPNIQPVNYGAPFANALSLSMQAKQVDANAAAANSQASKDMISSLAQAYKDLGKDGFNEFAKRVAPFLQTINPDDSYWSKQMKSQIYNIDMDSLNKDLQYELAKKFSPEQIQTSIQEANYRISEIVGRLNTMRITNEIAIKKLANETVVALAESFKLRKEGNKYEADAKTANALRLSLVKLIGANANQASLDYKRNKAFTSIILDPENVGKYADAYSLNLDWESDKVHQLVKHSLEDLGNILNVNIGTSEGSYSGKYSGSVHHTQQNYISADWQQTNPMGTKTKYHSVKYD